MTRRQGQDGPAKIGRLTHDFGGEYGSGRYHVHFHGSTLTIDGAEAGFMALLLSGRKLKPGVHWRQVFETEQ